jgi:NAD(P)-dependent dehydrogenase (short-subunit alcohol dehydrogenase family)
LSEFTGKTVIVTGASSGIGRALCLELAPQNPNLVLAARDAVRLEEVATECRVRGAQMLVVPTDVAAEDACRNLIDQTVERFGGIDVLVANAGRTMWARLDEMKDLSLYDELMRTNYFGAVYPTFHALTHLKKSRGRIVVVSSVAGLTGVPERTGYSATKHALFGFFESLRIELQDTGVTVTMVAPDFVRSEIHRRAIGPDGKPLGASPLSEERIMTAEECARRIVRAMEERRRLLITSTRGRLGRWVRLFAPRVIDAVARRAIRRGI